MHSGIPDVVITAAYYTDDAVENVWAVATTFVHVELEQIADGVDSYETIDGFDAPGGSRWVVHSVRSTTDDGNAVGHEITRDRYVELMGGRPAQQAVHEVGDL